MPSYRHFGINLLALSGDAGFDAYEIFEALLREEVQRLHEPKPRSRIPQMVELRSAQDEVHSPLGELLHGPVARFVASCIHQPNVGGDQLTMPLVADTGVVPARTL